MIPTNEAVRELKRRFEDPSVPLEEKTDIIEFFKNFNEIFYGDIDIDSFIRQLADITRKWEK